MGDGDTISIVPPLWSVLYLVSILKLAIWSEIKACEEFDHRYIRDIPRIKFFAQR